MEPILPKSRLFAFLETHSVFSRYFLLVVMLAIFYVQVFLWATPSRFSIQTIYTIEKGQSISSVASELRSSDIIRSPFLFKTLIVLISRGKGVKAGDYFFEKPASAYGVAKRLVKGQYGLVPLRVTIPEGFSVFDSARLLEKKLVKFDSKKFLATAHEGYLFPDTYFFLQNATADTVISMMEKNFNVKIADPELAQKIKEFGKPLDEIITMASILEEEARTTETREIISGILWKRIKIGMPLQVDVTFQYINGKNSYELSGSDLEIDSPYNTYKYKGFPPTPISSPGLDALNAAVSPKETPYLYFLSDRNGVMYYAKDFEGHKKNRELYL